MTETLTLKPRMPNPAVVLPGAMDALQATIAATQDAGLPPAILALTHLRASQINGCSACLDGGLRGARSAGESEERLAAVSAWRESRCFTAPERAALALAESLTRLSDRTDAVPDAVWEEAVSHFKETQLAALVLSIAVTNLFNRLNIATRQAPGSWG